MPLSPPQVSALPLSSSSPVYFCYFSECARQTVHCMCVVCCTTDQKLNLVRYQQDDTVSVICVCACSMYTTVQHLVLSLCCSCCAGLILTWTDSWFLWFSVQSGRSDFETGCWCCTVRTATLARAPPACEAPSGTTSAHRGTHGLWTPNPAHTLLTPPLRAHTTTPPPPPLPPPPPPPSGSTPTKTGGLGIRHLAPRVRPRVPYTRLVHAWRLRTPLTRVCTKR